MRKGLALFIISVVIYSTTRAADVPVGVSTLTTEVANTNALSPVAALTDAQKAVVRAEEIYRSEVRQELDAKADESQSSIGRLWTALNSSFVLWLLSSVVVSGIAACYTGWQNRHAKIKANQQDIDKLDTEISNRIYEALGAIRSYEGSVRNNKWLSNPKEYYGLMISYLDNHFTSYNNQTFPDFSIFPDLKDCGFRSLVTMLYDSLQSNQANQRKAAGLKDVLMTFESFANLGSIEEEKPDTSKENLLRVLSEIRETINTRVLKDRWRKDDLY